MPGAIKRKPFSKSVINRISYLYFFAYVMASKFTLFVDDDLDDQEYFHW